MDGQSVIFCANTICANIEQLLYTLVGRHFCSAVEVCLGITA